VNTHIGDTIFQDTSRRAAKFRENRPRDIEKSVVGNTKKIKHDQNITVFRYRWSDTRATVIISCICLHPIYNTVSLPSFAGCHVGTNS